MSDRTTSELAVVYAALILQDKGISVTADKLNALITAAGVDVEPIWATVFAKALEGKDVKDLIFNATSGPAAPAAAAPAAAAASNAPAAPAGGDKKAKKEEPKPESDEDIGFGKSAPSRSPSL